MVKLAGAEQDEGVDPCQEFLKDFLPYLQDYLVL
jgi:hypothetical protein